jgi:hypothetical protein
MAVTVMNMSSGIWHTFLPDHTASHPIRNYSSSTATFYQNMTSSGHIFFNHWQLNCLMHWVGLSEDGQTRKKKFKLQQKHAPFLQYKHLADLQFCLFVRWQQSTAWLHGHSAVYCFIHTVKVTFMGWEWVVKHHTLAALRLGKRPSTRCTGGGWVGPRAGLDGRGNSFPAGIWSLGRAAHSKSLYWLHYPNLPCFIHNKWKQFGKGTVILEYIISSCTFFVIIIILFCINHYSKSKTDTHLSLGFTAIIFSNTLLKTILQTDTLTFLSKRGSVCLTLLSCRNCSGKCDHVIVTGCHCSILCQCFVTGFTKSAAVCCCVYKLVL